MQLNEYFLSWEFCSDKPNDSDEAEKSYHQYLIKVHLSKAQRLNISFLSKIDFIYTLIEFVFCFRKLYSHRIACYPINVLLSEVNALWEIENISNLG